MKRLFFCLMAMFAILAFVACSENDVDNGGSGGGGQTPPKQPEITLDATASNFTTDGGQSEITFTSSVAWTAEVVNTRADAWCSIEPTSGAAGNAKITVTTTANDTPDDRSASIVIKAGTASKTINVSQKQKDALTVTASKFELGAEGGEVAIEVKANIDFEYVIEESAEEWIEYKTTRALKTSNLVFGVKENESEEKREARITITSGEFSEEVMVYQAGTGPSIVISQNEYTVSSDGETIAVEVSSNVDVAVEIPEDVDWIAENTTRATSTNTYYFDITKNEDYDQRSAEIKFTNKENNLSEVVKVTQVQKDAIVLAKLEYEFGTDGGNLDFEIHTNVDITVTISEDAIDWIQQVETRGLETKALYFNIAACSAEEDREGTITISGGNAMQTITVKQSDMAEVLEKEREALIALYEATGGDNWTHNDNWCSDKPVSEWYGIYCNDNGTVRDISLNKNNLIGEIPEEIGCFENIRQLQLGWNNLEGEVPDELWSLTSIEVIYLDHMKNLIGEIPAEIGNLFNLIDFSTNGSGFSGEIPIELGKLVNLQQLDLANCKYSGQIPIELGSLLNLQNLNLCSNQFEGEIPKQLGNLKQLKYLSLLNNKLTGSIPAELGGMASLEVLSLYTNQLTGLIPAELGNLSNLIELNLGQNQLTGSIPTELGDLKKLDNLSLWQNLLTGVVPQSIMELDCWDDCWHFILHQQGEGLSAEGVKIYAPEFSIPTIGGGVITNEFISQHKYTVLYNFFEWCPYSEGFTPILKSIVDKYKDSGLGIFSTTSDEESLVKACIDRNGIDWPCTVMQGRSSSPLKHFLFASPMVAVFDQNGLIVFNGYLTSYTELPAFIEELFRDNESASYESTDYSKDGVVKTLQTATKGDGIDIVLMGDAYSDRLIADGTYDNAMNTAMEKFFAVEPYKSFRNHFNVYSVTAVSQNEVYSDASSTVFEGYFGEGTRVGGNDEKVFEYAAKALSEELIDEALIVVMMNSPAYAGTCYMYGPSEGDWGDGASVSYFPVGVNDEALAQVLHHEAGGHGFAKLGDEYAYQENGTISGSEIADAQNMATYGWWKNVDFTSDPTQVKWSHFLSDARYASEGLGVYEGSFTYWSGAYRPTENSIMRYNVGGFNAPSREAIYYRIHKLAYGSSWQYDYEEFVEWDAKNRVTSSATRGVPYRLDIPDNFQPTHPPVVIKKSWREAMNE